MTPHNASALSEPKVSNTYSWFADYTKSKDDKPELPERHTALPPFHSEGSGNVAELHPDGRVAIRGWLLQRADERVEDG